MYCWYCNRPNYNNVFGVKAVQADLFNSGSIIKHFKFVFTAKHILKTYKPTKESILTIIGAFYPFVFEEK